MSDEARQKHVSGIPCGPATPLREAEQMASPASPSYLFLFELSHNVSVPAACLPLQAEKLFVRNLLDECPRCGFNPPQSADFESLSMHLKGCNDKRAHEAHRRSQAAAAAAREAKERREDADVEAQNLAAWQFLGGSTESMWLLTDTQLKKQCEGAGVESNGGREEMLARLSRHHSALQSQRLTSKGAERPMLSLKTAPGKFGST